MVVEQNRQRLANRINELLVQGKFELGRLPRGEAERLVALLADGLLLTLNEMLDDLDDSPRAGLAGAPADEMVLWEGRPFLSLLEHYTVTSQRIRIRRGLLSRATDDIELIRLQDIDLTQKVGERMVNIGDLTLRSADKSEPVAILQNIHEPERVHDIIRRAMLEARRRHGVRLREEL